MLQITGWAVGCYIGERNAELGEVDDQLEASKDATALRGCKA